MDFGTRMDTFHPTNCSRCTRHNKLDDSVKGFILLFFMVTGDGYCMVIGEVHYPGYRPWLLLVIGDAYGQLPSYHVTLM